MFSLVIDRGDLLDAVGRAVDAHSQEPLRPQFIPQLRIALADGDFDGGCDVQTSPCGEGEDAFDDLVGGLADDGDLAGGTVRLSQAGEEDSQIVIDFGDGADGGAGAVADGLLLDGDGG